MPREAKATLSAAGITVGQDFASLTPEQIAAVRTEAAAAYHLKHGKPLPKPERETYVRKRYDLLQRRARS